MQAIIIPKPSDNEAKHASPGADDEEIRLRNESKTTTDYVEIEEGEVAGVPKIATDMMQLMTPTASDNS